MSNKNYAGNRALLKQLESLRLTYDLSSARAKVQLIRSLSKRAISNLEELKNYHEQLCFLRAYPDNKHLLELVESELRDLIKRVRSAFTANRKAALSALTDSGIVGTAVEHPFSLDLVRLLLKYYPNALEIDWANSDEYETGNLLSILPFLVSWQTNDAIDNDEDITAQSLLKRARPGISPSDLMTLVIMLANPTIPKPLQRHLFESAEIQSRWELGNSPASRTLCRMTGSPRFYQTESIKPRSLDLRAEILSASTPLRQLSRKDGEQAVRIVNEVLAVRSRELFCITHASPEEVYVVEPGRGVQIFLFGSKPEIRLPIESNFGALLVRNGMPIGYGVGACVFNRVEIAINIFPTFRAGESPFIIEQFFKAFYHHFGSRVFVVRSRQMGDGDDEPIFAGSFWFYYKLGFRAVKPAIRALAEREHDRIVRNPKHRSSIAMLRRLSKSDVFFHIDPSKMSQLNELSIVKLAYAVTRHVARDYEGSPTAAEWLSIREIASRLKIPDCPLWSHDERTACLRVGPLLTAIPEIYRWNRAEKIELVRIIRAKGQLRERDFVLRCIRHPKLRAALTRLAASQR